VRRERNRGAGVMSHAENRELRRAVSDVTRGERGSVTDGRRGLREGGSAARPMDEGSARRSGVRGKKTLRRCEKDSATCGKRVALSV